MHSKFDPTLSTSYHAVADKSEWAEAVDTFPSGSARGKGQGRPRCDKQTRHDVRAATAHEIMVCREIPLEIGKSALRAMEKGRSIADGRYPGRLPPPG